MQTRDGVRLDADIYRPDSAESFPVLLMRQPYGRAIASTVVYAHPRWYAAHGYIVVIQDVRGRGTSAGEFTLFAHEVEDGADTVNWAAQLPGSTGDVGMYGFSYQGMTQLYATVEQPSALKTICPAMLGYDLYTDWAYEGGAFCLQANLGWAVQLAAETARLQGDMKAFEMLYATSRNLPFHHPYPRFVDFKKYDSYYFEWLKHPHPGEYWEQLSPSCLMQEVDLPMLHIGGWFDPFLRGTLNLYQEMARSQYPQRLVIGPWAHLPWGRRVGAIDYGEEAASPVDTMQVRWFDQFLKGKDTGLLAQPTAYLFEMGSNQWRSFDRFSTSEKPYYLATNGLASIREDAGKLVTQIPPLQQDVFVHDPWRPVPALGGHAAVPPGAFERSHLDCRTDVLIYTSDALDEDLAIAGTVEVQLYCTADAPSFDLCAVLSEVRDGSVYNFTQGYRRVNGDVPIQIRLQATCMRIRRGNRLRLSLSAACFPAYPVNPGTDSVEAGLMNQKMITLTVSSGGTCVSHVLLPEAMPLS